MDHTHHMHDMCHTGSAFPGLQILAILFLAGAFFYCFRFLARNYVASVNGYHDRENEFWHLLCMVAMAACLAPGWSLVPNLFWLLVFPLGAAWYLVRAFTYGRKLPHNKQWYDLAHAAMLTGMWWMFAMPVSGIFVTVVLAGYWTWFGGYYATRLWADVKKPHWLSLGQDSAHFAMAVVMALMTVRPSLFM